MAFRANEAKISGHAEIENYFLRGLREIDEAEREESKERLAEIIEDYGPVVDSYPSWHPFISHAPGFHRPQRPDEQCGYLGLDHTRYFANAFITCPYVRPQDVINSVEEINKLLDRRIARIEAKFLDVKLYHSTAKPILVTCEWAFDIDDEGIIPMSRAVPLLLEKEVPAWRKFDVDQSWETMRPFLLGSPHGSRSSLFVNQETGQAIKKIWNALVSTGMYDQSIK